MEIIVNSIPIIVGLWMIYWSQMISAKGVQSILIFKTIPFFLGLASLFSGGKLLGWF